MRGFRFRLEPVLRVRDHEVDRSRSELAHARLAAAAAAQQARRAVEQRELAQSGLEARLAQGARAGDVRQRAASVLLLASRARSAEGESGVLEEGVAQARARLLEARTRARVLEILRDRARDVHRCEVERRERRDLDEVGVRLHWRGRGE